MSNRSKLAANLPAAPLTAEQRALFEEHLPVAEYMASVGARKYGAEMSKVVHSAAHTGLMCAAARYETPSEASFKTFAIRTINWVMRLDVRRELGLAAQDPDRRRAYLRSLHPGRKQQPTFEPSAYRSTGDLPAIGFELDEGDRWQVLSLTQADQEELLLERERLALGRHLLKRVAAGSQRNALFLERWLDGETLESIGKSHRISRQRVQQLVKFALDDARKIAKRQRLQAP